MDPEKQISKSLEEFGSCRNSHGPEEDWDFLQSLLMSWYSHAACGASSENCILAAWVDFSAVPVDSLYTRPPPARFPGVCSVGTIVWSRFAFRSQLVEPIRWRYKEETRHSVDYLRCVNDPLCLGLTSCSIATGNCKIASIARVCCNVYLQTVLPLLPPSVLCQDYADFHYFCFFFFKEEFEWGRAFSFFSLSSQSFLCHMWSIQKSPLRVLLW